MPWIAGAATQPSAPPAMPTESVDYAAIDAAVKRHQALVSKLAALQEMSDLLNAGAKPYLSLERATGLPLEIQPVAAREAVRDAMAATKAEEARLARRLEGLSKVTP